MKPFLLIKTPERQFKFKIVENMGIFKEIIYNDNHIVAYRSASGKKRIYLKNSPSVEEWKEIAKNILINMLGYVPHARVTVRCMKKKLSFEVGRPNKKVVPKLFMEVKTPDGKSRHFTFNIVRKQGICLRLIYSNGYVRACYGWPGEGLRTGYYVHDIYMAGIDKIDWPKVVEGLVKALKLPVGIKVHWKILI